MDRPPSSTEVARAAAALARGSRPSTNARALNTVAKRGCGRRSAWAGPPVRQQTQDSTKALARAGYERVIAWLAERAVNGTPAVDCCWASESIISALALRGVRFLGSGRVAREGGRLRWGLRSCGR